PIRVGRPRRWTNEFSGAGRYQRRPPPPRLPKPPPPPLRLPPAPVELATSTFSVRPSRSLPLNFLTASAAASADAISTKPNPRDCPVSRSITTAADSTAPASANTSRSRSVDVEKARPPMKSLCAIANTSGDLPQLRTLPGTRGRLRQSRDLERQEVHDEPDSRARWLHDGTSEPGGRL